MSSWFAKRTAVAVGDPDTQLGAYKEGRRDERLQTEAAAPDRRLAKAELNEARDRGRRDERLSNRASPLGLLLRVLLFALAIAAVVAIVIAVQYGSFAAAGQVIDTQLAALVQLVSAR
jgi:hypothetical protein